MLTWKLILDLNKFYYQNQCCPGLSETSILDKSDIDYRTHKKALGESIIQRFLNSNRKQCYGRATV